MRSVIERETDVTLSVGHGTLGHHDSRREVLNQEAIMAKERWDELDVGALRLVVPFSTAVKTRSIVNIGMQEDVKDTQDESTTHRETLPIVTLGESFQESHGGRADQSQSEGVGRVQELYGLFDAQFTRDHRSILPDNPQLRGANK